MDTIYKGLTAPRAQVAAGRPDIPDEERPGAILVGMVREAAKVGLARPEREEIKGPGPVDDAVVAVRVDRAAPEDGPDAELNG